MSAGEAHSLAVDADGELYSWGMCAEGRLGLHKAALVGESMLALPTRVSPRLPDTARQRAGDKAATFRVRVVYVSAGEAHSLALCACAHGQQQQQRARSLDEPMHTLAWGRNKEGQLGLSDEKLRWRPTQIAYFSGVAQRMVAAATIHSAALDAAGHAYTWGVDAGGRLGRLDDPSARNQPRRVLEFVSQRVLEVAVGREHTLFLLESGHVYACGKNTHGQLGLGEHPAVVAMGAADNALSAPACIFRVDL